MYMVLISFRVSIGADSMISNSAPSASIFTRSVWVLMMWVRVVVWVAWVLSDFFVNEWLWESSLRYRVACPCLFEIARFFAWMFLMWFCLRFSLSVVKFSFSGSKITIGTFGFNVLA